MMRFSFPDGTVPTTHVKPGDDGFFAFGNVAPVRFVVRDRPEPALTLYFLEEPDIRAVYAPPLRASPWDLQMSDMVAIAELACNRADMIWTAYAGATDAARYEVLNTFLQSLGFVTKS